MVDKREAAKRDGFVYGMIHPNYPDLVKIGRSRDPLDRLVAANTWCPTGGYELIAQEYFVNTIGVEHDIHKLLGARRVLNSEWFECSVEWFCRNLTMLSHGCANG